MVLKLTPDPKIAADEVTAHRTWAWCQALAVVLALSRLSRSSQDPIGGEMLAIARTTTTA